MSVHFAERFEPADLGPLCIEMESRSSSPSWPDASAPDLPPSHSPCDGPGRWRQFVADGAWALLLIVVLALAMCAGDTLRDVELAEATYARIEAGR